MRAREQPHLVVLREQRIDERAADAGVEHVKPEVCRQAVELAEQADARAVAAGVVMLEPARAFGEGVGPGHHPRIDRVGAPGLGHEPDEVERLRWPVDAQRGERVAEPSVRLRGLGLRATRPLEAERALEQVVHRDRLVEGHALREFQQRARAEELRAGIGGALRQRTEQQDCHGPGQPASLERRTTRGERGEGPENALQADQGKRDHGEVAEGRTRSAERLDAAAGGQQAPDKSVRVKAVELPEVAIHDQEQLEGGAEEQRGRYLRG
jgi:hypothetical protein